MHSRVLAVGVALLAVGFLVGLLTSDTEVQASAELCAAPWVVTVVATRPASGGAGGGQEGGAVILKHNRCTGETFVLAYDGPMLEQDDKNAGTSWRLFPTAGATQ